MRSRTNGKFHQIACREATVSTHTAQFCLYMGADFQLQVPVTLPRRKIRYPNYRRMGEPQGRSRRVRKIMFQPGFQPRTVSRTDHDETAEPEHKLMQNFIKTKYPLHQNILQFNKAPY